MGDRQTSDYDVAAHPTVGTTTTALTVVGLPLVLACINTIIVTCTYSLEEADRNYLCIGQLSALSPYHPYTRGVLVTVLGFEFLVVRMQGIRASYQPTHILPHTPRPIHSTG